MEMTLRRDVDFPQSLGERLGAFLRAKGSAKVLASAINCDIRTAENLRRGVWPIERHFDALRRVYGRPFLAALFWPDEEAARIEEECRELASQLEAKRMAARALATAQGPQAARLSSPTNEGFR